MAHTMGFFNYEYFCFREAMTPFMAAIFTVAVAKNVTISNVWPRHNVSGAIMDAHDGTYNQWTPGGPWYFYAMGTS